MLSEAVLALFVTVLTITILQQAIILSHKVMNLESYSNIHTHIVQERLEELFDGKILVIKNRQGSSHQELRLFNSDTDGANLDLYISLANGFLYESQNGGFEPIMNDVKDFQPLKVGQNLLLKIIQKNGTETEMFFSHVEWQT
ncbi:hypothetical protein [Companilactobacillus furfuricola]|uniref:hypothetical protein n=1 Tax=Companilactobacillus furfuricola TaxID=1462575 RepID=UPI000F7A921B|nr:hypothetical protein [Companilactobacillus furfuricola]